MFIKLNRSGSRVYAQLAEAFRDEAGNPRNRVIATLGRVDKDDPNINSVLAGLVRATGSSVDLQPPSIDFDASRDFGDLWALQALWDESALVSCAACFATAAAVLRPSNCFA